MLLSFFGGIQLRGFQRLVTQQHFHLHSATWMSLSFGSWKFYNYFSNAPFRPEKKTISALGNDAKYILSCKKIYPRVLAGPCRLEAQPSRRRQIRLVRQRPQVLSYSRLQYQQVFHRHYVVPLSQLTSARISRKAVLEVGAPAYKGVWEQSPQLGPGAQPLVRGQGRSFSAFEHQRRSQIWLFLCIFHVFYIRSIYFCFVYLTFA